jgi:CRP-like cAMP-binding protein
MPQTEFNTLEPHLEFVSLDLATNLQRESEPIDFAYFMNSGIVSMIVEMADGRSVEVGIAGREDMIGLQLAAGLKDAAHNLVIQVPGDGFRVKASTLQRELRSLPELSRLLTRRLGIRSLQFAQNAACNRLHSIRQRMARWLLVTRDRIDTDLIATTHDFLAKMVGTDRPSVSVALAELQREAIILGSRGIITLLDRERLEEHACECYQMFKQFNGELGLK